MSAFAIAAAFLFGIGAGGLAAETPEETVTTTPDPYEVTVFNAHRHVVQVFVEGPGSEDELLGTLETDEVKTFVVPGSRMTGERTFRVTVQPLGPQPGLGQSRAASRRTLETYPVPRAFDGVLKLIVAPKLVNSNLNLVENVR